MCNSVNFTGIVRFSEASCAAQINLVVCTDAVSCAAASFYVSVPSVSFVEAVSYVAASFANVTTYVARSSELHCSKLRPVSCAGAESCVAATFTYVFLPVSYAGVVVHTAASCAVVYVT